MPRRAAAVTDAERALVGRALRQPWGRYVAERAGQLSGVPARTLHDWAAAGVLVPDWGATRPRAWSYRDVVYARLLAWLRSKGMDRPAAAARVAQLRTALAAPEPAAPAAADGPVPTDGEGDHSAAGGDGSALAGGDGSAADGGAGATVHSDGHVLLVGDEPLDRVSGQQAFAGVTGLLDTFSLTEPVEGVSRSGLWGPGLVRPSAHTTISPWVLGGEPCVKGSRVPTALLRALQVDRGLDVEAIGALYPFLSAAAIADALALEERLRAA